MKFLLLFLTLCSINVLAQNYSATPGDEPRYKRLSIFGSLKIANNISVSRAFDSKNLAPDPAYGIGLEFKLLNNEKSNAGIGSEYQFLNSVNGIEGSYQNIPVYLFSEFSLVNIKYFNLPDIHFQLGYNFLNIKDKFLFADEGSSAGNGIYYALGFSADISNHLKARLLYSVNQGSITYQEEKFLFSSSKVSLSCAFTF
jgi:hypothetical protein